MRKCLKLSLALVLFSTCARGQDYKAAKKVYFTVLQDKIYYAIDLNRVKYDSLRIDGGKTPNALINVDLNAPIYHLNGDYKKGDILRVLVEDYDDDDLYSYIKIIGEVDDAILSNIDNHLRTKCAELFGEGKLEPWPEEYYEDKGIRGVIPNEIEIDADYYILSSIENINANIKESLFKMEASLTKGETGNLIIFYVDEISGDKYAIKEVENLTSSFYKIDIRWKGKAGKKGKKIGGNSMMDLTDEDKTVTDSFEKEIVVDGTFSRWDVNGWVVMNDKADELVRMNNKYLEVKVLKSIDKAFSKIK
jgi:hypothetical protein